MPGNILYHSVNEYGVCFVAQSGGTRSSSSSSETSDHHPFTCWATSCIYFIFPRHNTTQNEWPPLSRVRTQQRSMYSLGLEMQWCIYALNFHYRYMTVEKETHGCSHESTRVFVLRTVKKNNNQQKLHNQMMGYIVMTLGVVTAIILFSIMVYNTGVTRDMDGKNGSI